MADELAALATAATELRANPKHAVDTNIIDASERSGLTQRNVDVANFGERKCGLEVRTCRDPWEVQGIERDSAARPAATDFIIFAATSLGCSRRFYRMHAIL
jgi:hypothetical protein